MSSGALRCSGCGSISFCVDEVSGHYVCTSCWQVSESFEGVIQNHESRDGRYGLRVVNAINSLSQRDVLLHSSVLGEGQTQDASEVFNGSISTSPTTKRRHKEHEGRNADHAVAAMSTKKTHKEKCLARSRLRSWRMSEAFTLLLQRQLKALIGAHLTPEPTSFPGIVNRFTSIASTLWTNYLSATGELGGDLWALSFRRMLTALELTLESRRSYIKNYSTAGENKVNQALPDIGRAGEKDGFQLTRIMASKLGFGFCWIGWGSLYCPNESLNANNPFFLFETNCDQENQSSMKCSGEDDADKFSITLSVSDSDSVDGEPPQKRQRQLVLSPQSLPAQQFPEEQTGMPNDVQKLSKLWKEMLTENLITKQSKREVFWQGHLFQSRSNLLLEYNLGILFLAGLLTLTAINAEKVPICQHDFFTLHDLSCLCRDRDKFPYLMAERWVSNHFASFSVATQKSLMRSMTPDPSVLTTVTIHLINILGLTERPRLPLCSLVHRLLRKMNFPPEAHQIADTLVAKLARFVNNAAEMKEAMHYFLPLHRYLRGEVFAMAIVAITGRLLFKLDGNFEYRWSNVARFLTQHPQEATLLEEVLSEGAQTEKSGRAVPFDWSKWICGLPKGPPYLRRPHSDLSNGDAPLNAVRSHSHMVRTARNAKEFLGSASSFDPQVDVGWGEKHGTPKCNASAKVELIFAFQILKKATKLSLTESLTQLIDRSCIATNKNIETPRQNAKFHSIPCKSCVRSIKHTIFRRVSDQAEGAEWVNKNCDALVRAYQFIRQKKIPASELLNKIHPSPSKPDDIYMDWLHLLENYDSYDPISAFSFTTELDQIPSLTTIPPTVMKFLGDYRKRVFDFLSGNKVDPSSAVNDFIAPPESKKKAGDLANASLNWFLKTASSMCGVKPSHLLREIKCVEYLLGFWSGEKLTRPTKLRNLALAFHFDYTVPE